MNLRHVLPAGTLALGLLLAPAASHAQGLLDMTFTHPTLTVGNGGVVTFTGSVANNSGGTVYLYSDGFTGFSPGVSADGSPFLIGAPLSLADGTAYSGALFSVTPTSTAHDGLYSGYFNILGGPAPTDQIVEATQKFNLQVVPEPSSLASLSLLALGAGLMALRATRRRRSAA